MLKEKDYLFDDGEHFFGPSESTPGFMTQEELEALRDTFEQPENLLAIDPIPLSRKLYEKRIFTRRLLNEIMIMKANGRSDSVILNYLFSLIPANVNLKSLARLLYECDYKRIAERLFYNYLRKRCPSSKATNGHSEPRIGLRNVSRRLKSEVHNAPFENREQHLRRKENKFASWMSKAINTNSRQCMADILITIIGAEVDAIAITFNTELYENDIFQRYETYIEESSNSVLSRIGFLGRWANACAIAGKHVEAEEKLREARCLAIFVGPSIEQFNSFYTEVYRRLWEYEQYPSQTLKKSILFWGKVGLKCIEDETDPYTVNAWKKNNMIRMSLCLLGLGNTTRVIDRCTVDQEDIDEAGLFIQELSSPEIMNSIELRRLMLFFIIKARWLELKECFTDSLLYYNYARCNAETGKSAELNCILEHIERVTDKINANAYSEPSKDRGNNLIIPSLERNSLEIRDNQHVVRLKEISLDERDPPSGCSRPDDPITKLEVNVRNVEVLAAPFVCEEESEDNVARSTELKCIHSENVSVFPLDLSSNQKNNVLSENELNSEADQSVKKCQPENSCEQFALQYGSAINVAKDNTMERTGLINSKYSLFASSDIRKLSKVKNTIDVDQSSGKDCFNSSCEPFALPFEPVSYSFQKDNSHEYTGLINSGDSLFGSYDTRQKPKVENAADDYSAGKDQLNSSCEPFALSFKPAEKITKNNSNERTGPPINSGDSLFGSYDKRQNPKVENAADGYSAGKDQFNSSCEPFAIPFEPAEKIQKDNATEHTNDSLFSPYDFLQKPNVDNTVDHDWPIVKDRLNSSCEPFAMTYGPDDGFPKYNVTERKEENLQNTKVETAFENDPPAGIDSFNSSCEPFALPFESVNNSPSCNMSEYTDLINSGDSLFRSVDNCQKTKVLNTVGNDLSSANEPINGSRQPFAMTCEPCSYFPKNNVTECNDFNSGDLLFCSFDIGQTGVKQLESSVNQKSASPQLENSNNDDGDIDQAAIGIYGNRIPSWEREPPSGQSYE